MESVDEFAVDPRFFPWRARGAVRPLQTCVGEFRCELSEAVGGESDRTRHVGSTRPKNRWSDGRRLEVRTKGTGSLKAMNRWDDDRREFRVEGDIVISECAEVTDVGEMHGLAKGTDVMDLSVVNNVGEFGVLHIVDVNKKVLVVDNWVGVVKFFNEKFVMNKDGMVVMFVGDKFEGYEKNVMEPAMVDQLVVEQCTGVCLEANKFGDDVENVMGENFEKLTAEGELNIGEETVDEKMVEMVTKVTAEGELNIDDETDGILIGGVTKVTAEGELDIPTKWDVVGISRKVIKKIVAFGKNVAWTACQNSLRGS